MSGFLLGAADLAVQAAAGGLAVAGVACAGRACWSAHRGRAAARRWSGPERRTRCRRHAYRARLLLWGGLLALLGVGVFARALGLDVAFTELGRTIARAHDWYLGRRPFQLAGMGFAAIAAIAVGIVLLRALRHEPGGVRLALAGGTMCALVALARLVSHHDVDAFLVTAVGATFERILIVAGPALVIAGALRTRRRARPAHA